MESFLKIDQKEPSLWDLLAKAYYKSKQYTKAINSLKHQASLEDSIIIWNNMAITYWSKGDTQKAYEYFSLAMKNNEIPDIINLNFINYLIDNKKYSEIITIFNKNKSSIFKSLSNKKNNLFYIILNYIEANFRMENKNGYILVLEDILKKYDPDISIKIQFLIKAIYYYTLLFPDLAKALYYSKLSLNIINKTKEIPSELDVNILNNIIFCYIESNDIDEAEKLISKLSPYIYKLSYPTATLGLINIKKGNIKKGKNLYEKAIGLLLRDEEKDKFRQKLYFELGKFYSEKDNQKSREFYTKALKLKHGFSFIYKECEKLLKW